MIILGYAGYNLTLREQHILINRTCRESTARERGILYLEELFFKNLSDLLKTLQWTAENNIKFYRVSSGLAPHCTNSRMFDIIPNVKKEDIKEYKDDYTKLLYPLENFEKYLKKIGDYAKKNHIRITFHPDLFAVLNSPSENVVLNTFRELHYHAKLLDLMGLDNNSVIILHGGGIYGDKQNSMKRWVENFNKLPLYIKQRVVLENDETCFSAEDVLKMSASVQEFTLNIQNKIVEKAYSKVPIVFDIFHYYCYNQMLIKRNLMEKQKNISELLSLAKETWDRTGRKMKIHLSEQLANAPMGAHSDFIDSIPDELIEFAKKIEKENGDDIYVMCEAKSKELAVLHLRQKYPEICI